VELWDRREAPHSLAIVRIVLPLVWLTDLLQAWRLDLVTELWAPSAAGGFGNPLSREPPPWLYTLFPADADTTAVAFGVLVAAALCVSLGLFTRLSALTAILIAAQFSRTLPLADRAIDLLIRDVLLLLALSQAGGAWSVDSLIFGRRATIPAWPRHLLILQVAFMYFAAGIQKVALDWTPFGGFSALYIVLQDPAVARHPLGWVRSAYPLTQALTAGTMLFEYGAGLVPLFYWFRDTRTRGGRLRAWCNRLDARTGWLAGGVALHLGIAATMQLGIFPWAMLACYPAFFHPDEWRRLRDTARR
jgi:uncharacterized membrane protein YphA (DoxX/SURF4 family)